jgi:hypothetical protein
MRLRTRYKKLNFWNKLFVWAGIATFIGLAWGIISPYFSARKLDKIDDKVERLATTEDVENIVKKYASRHDKFLEEKYASSPSFFGATDKGAIVPYGPNPQGVNIDWMSAGVLDATPDIITIQVPEISINTDNIKGLKFTNVKFKLVKKFGYTMAPIGNGRFEIRATVME